MIFTPISFETAASRGENIAEILSERNHDDSTVLIFFFFGLGQDSIHKISVLSQNKYSLANIVIVNVLEHGEKNTDNFYVQVHPEMETI